jgi:DNA-binding PadR family transcriptional regulator
MAADLTLPDLVVLHLLAERPMHGYELNQELERREVRDWAGISRPQVYYSLKKLAAGGQLARAVQGGAGPGPERQVWRISAAGRRALAQALGREAWAEQRPPPPFLTWLALSDLADPADRLRVIRRRRAFLQGELDRERATLDAILADTGPMVPAGALMVRLVIRQWEVEIEWLAEVEATLGGSGDSGPGHQGGDRPSPGPE